MLFFGDLGRITFLFVRVLESLFPVNPTLDSPDRSGESRSLFLRVARENS